MIALANRRRSRNQSFSTAEAFENIRADYNAARESRYRRRRTGVSGSGSGADYHYRSESDYLRMLEQARDMDRNDVVVGQTVDRAVNNTIQDGFRLDPATGDKALNFELWERWQDWANDPEQCDLAGEMTFYDMERLTFRATIVDGDILALPISDGPLELVEGHRLRTPKNTSRNVVHGVLMNDRRRRLEYWITKDDIDPLKSVNRVSDIVPYFARDKFGVKQVFHIFNPKRVSQTRGVTSFAPIFDTLGMFEDIQFAKLVQQQIVSCFAIFREQASDGGLPSVDSQYGERENEVQGDGSNRVVEGVAPGMEITGKPGEKLNGFSPNIPNAEFFNHVRLILTLVGINLGMPLVMVLMDASETNFSGWRGAVDEARRGFRRNQKAHSLKFHKPVYEWKVRQWIAEDSVLRATAQAIGNKIFAHRWNMPRWPYIQPLQDASADLLRVRNGLTSPRRLHAENGNGDWEEIVTETIADNAYAIVRAKRVAQKINKRYDDGNPVHWREVISLPTPDGVKVDLGAPVGAGVDG